MAEKNSSVVPSCVDPSVCWGISQTEHCSAYPSCQMADPCCDDDNCSVQCSSACDGYVACDASTACSEVHCDDQSCQGLAPVCFDQSCVGDSQTDFDNGICDILNQDSSFNWNSESLLTSTSNTHYNNPFHSHHDTSTNICNEMSSTDHFAQPEQSLSNSRSYGFQFYQGHDSSLQGSTTTDPPTPSAPGMNQTIDLCPSLDNCNHQSHFGPVYSDCNPDEFLGFIPMEFQSQFHSIYPQLYPRFDGGLKLPCEMQPQHVHKNTSHQTQHSGRPTSSSLDSVQLKSSPSFTPPPKDSDITSLTSPDVDSADEPHICKCIVKDKLQGTATICGASFPDAGKLQEHLIQTHVGMVDGCQGHGFYCCWEGCHRPDEPFSQKSKLQGHFLTHSNHKGFRCSVCGKPFARQATLERHERSHRGEKPFACKLCDKSFTDSSELKTHMRIHTGEKPFKCNHPGCNFETGDSSNMSSHKLTHGVRKHRCHFAGCSKSFTRPDQLKRHLKTTHKEDSGSSVSLSSPVIDQFPLPQFEPPSGHSSLSVPYQDTAMPLTSR
ncbi:hypothetical protein AJ79_02358 [Helicocarpus griseus UAMH5409]|uniref:C2H2-type domain-containing protein n=1 Tax=Helicocarpus griseus UAMH5409 TaxID=1447875 RepID=A0A2B7Y271_9EURO|nr:hypothetical protein AJ79_02358 [Helicocarpus griseus UAMH5409]